MKVILTQDVAHLGGAGEIKEVANGYARNFLLPRGLAQPATAGMVKVIEERKAAEARRVAKAEEENRALADLIAQQTLTIQARVGKQGRLYGSVTAADIANMLSQKLGQTIDRRKVELADNIHSIGTYEATVRLVGRLAPKVKVVVEPDAESAPAQEAEAAPAAEEALTNPEEA
jgi:large subunit ribosomal protein L9